MQPKGLAPGVTDRKGGDSYITWKNGLLLDYPEGRIRMSGSSFIRLAQPGRIPGPSRTLQRYFNSIIIEQSPGKKGFEFKVIVMSFVPEAGRVKIRRVGWSPEQPIGSAQIPLVRSG
jgi:hypothetical protein